MQMRLALFGIRELTEMYLNDHSGHFYSSFFSVETLLKKVELALQKDVITLEGYLLFNNVILQPRIFHCLVDSAGFYMYLN